MNKISDSKNFIWPGVIIILMLALILGVVLYYFNYYPKTTVQDSIKTTLSVEEKSTQEALFNSTPPVGAVFKPADKLILKTVNFDSSGKIDEIIMFVPELIVDGTILINGNTVDVQHSQQENAFVLSFQVPENLRKTDITFLVMKNGKQAATCTLIKSESLSLTGDCIF